MTTIESEAFYGCSGVKSFYLLANLNHTADYVGLFTGFLPDMVFANSSEIPYIVKCYLGIVLDIKNPYYFTFGNVKLGSVTFSIANNKYVSATLKSIKFRNAELTPDENGKYTITGLEPSTRYEVEVTYQNEDGEVNSYTLDVYTKTPTIKTSVSETQTTITISVDAESDEICTPKRKGIHYDGKDYYCTGDKVVLRGLKPNSKYYFTPFAEYGGKRFDGDKYNYITASMNPSITANVGPTSISATVTYDKGDAHVSETGFIGQGTGNSLVLTGLTPNTSYTVEYYVKTEEGSYEKAKQTLTTPSLELTTLQPRCVSSTCAIVAAKTNMSDDEINAGFQWRKYDAPEELKSSEGYAAIYGGQLEGYIKNLQSASYYNVRAFYKSAEGKYYYGDWVTFDPSDFSYFEPTVHTYEATEIGSSSAKVKGYVLAGTDDIIEQGFEYWTTGSTECKAMHVRATDENNMSTVFSTGQVMTATLTDLLPSSTYCFHSFVKTASGTTYGEEQTFTTDASTTGIGNVETDVSSPVVVGYYDLSGRKHCEPQKGMNIVRYSDGSVRKVLIR